MNHLKTNVFRMRLTTNIKQFLIHHKLTGLCNTRHCDFSSL